MANIRKMKKRIEAVRSIRKISHAMELISSSKLKKAKKENEEVLKYNSLINTTFEKIFENLYSWELKELIESRSKSENTFYVVITSDLGLAGSYNSNIIKLAKKIIKEDDKMVIIGQYGLRGLMPFYKKQIITSIDQSKSRTYQKIVKDIVKLAMDLYEEEKIGKIEVIYTKFLNNLNQVETSEQVFPIDIEWIKEGIQMNIRDNILEFEPNPKFILQDAIPLYIDSKIYSALSNAKISEACARKTAMNNATDNADEIIKNLKQAYNRKRQAKITQEIIEIVSAAEAMKN